MDEGLQRWAVDTVAPGAEVVGVRGLRDGGSPYRVTYRAGGATGSVIVRVGGPDDKDLFDLEAAALRVVEATAVPAPRLLGVAGAPALLIEDLPGSSRIPDTASPARLRALGAAVAGLRAVTPPDGVLPRRTRPIAGVDFGALRREQPERPLLAEAAARIGARPVPGAFTGLVHGDLWQGNALWDGDRITGLIDWDCAGVGPAGVDLGALRFDAALCYGAGFADEVSAGYAAVSGGEAEDVAYWDVVAALSSPPDMGWFVGAMHGQGRTDLTRAMMIDRRDGFLAAALAAL